jgi:hypothetical protein
MRRSAAQHYREGVRARAYWGRHYDKWIIGNRVFYTDEVLGDILSCLFAGPALNVAFALLLDKVASDYLSLPFAIGTFQLHALLAASISTSLLLLLTRMYDRCHLADQEIARREVTDPSFSGDAEMRRILEGERTYIRRVLGKHATPRRKDGE